jgi:HEAT repeat protein
MSFYPELDNLDLQNLIERFYSSHPTEDKYIYFQEVAYRIRQKGEKGNAFLLATLLEGIVVDEELLLALMVALNFQPAKKYGILQLNDGDQAIYINELIAYLQSIFPSIVGEAVKGIWLYKVKEARDKILALQKHPSEDVRSHVLRYLMRIHPNKALPILLEFLGDPASDVRETAADELGSLGHAEAIPHLRPLLSDPVVSVQEAAENAIKILVG